MSAPKPYYETPASAPCRVRLYLGDCRELSESFTEPGVVITDPPYSAHTHSKSRRGGPSAPPLDGAGRAAKASFSRVKEFGFEHLAPSLRRFCAREFSRLAQRWVLVFSDVESSWLWRISLTANGLEYVRTGAWHKIGATPQFTGDRPAVAFEAITIVHPKGKKRWNGGGSHALWSVPIVLERGTAEPRLHPTQKPEGLLLALIDAFSEPGETVYDFFAGAGTTGVCAFRRGRNAVLIERNEAFCEQAAKRLLAEAEGVGFKQAQAGQIGLFAIGGQR